MTSFIGEMAVSQAGRQALQNAPYSPYSSQHLPQSYSAMIGPIAHSMVAFVGAGQTTQLAVTNNKAVQEGNWEGEE